MLVRALLFALLSAACDGSPFAPGARVVLSPQGLRAGP